MSKQISVARALSELKLTTNKIVDKTNSLLVAQGVVTSRTTDEQRNSFKKKFNSDYQQIQDLIKYRDQLKAAIVASNAVTDVVVAGTTMKVSEAIEQKASIQLKKNLVNKLRTVYYTVVQQVEQANNNVAAKADAQVAQTEGSLYESVVKAYKAENGVEVLSVESLSELIEKENEKVVDFEADVDFALSESNVKTMITI